MSTKLNSSKYCYLPQGIQLNISHLFTQLNDQTVLFQTIQFSISTRFKCQILLFDSDRTLSGITSPGQSGPGSDGNEGVHCIPQRSRITEASWTDCLVSYPGHSLGESYPSTEMQSAPANQTMMYFSVIHRKLFFGIILLLYKKYSPYILSPFRRIKTVCFVFLHKFLYVY